MSQHSSILHNTPARENITGLPTSTCRERHSHDACRLLVHDADGAEPAPSGNDLRPRLVDCRWRKDVEEPRQCRRSRTRWSTNSAPTPSATFYCAKCRLGRMEISHATRWSRRINSDLANGIGNLLSRTLHDDRALCDGKIPDVASGYLRKKIAKTAMLAVTLETASMH